MDMSNNFADRLMEAVDEKKNPSVAGLDPALGSLPGHITEKYRLESGKSCFSAAAEAVVEFNKGIIEAVSDIVPAVKLQVAYYEQLGPDGMGAFIETCDIARKKGLLIIGDVKRNDIGNTCQAYSNAWLGKVDIFGEKKTLYDTDAITVNSYLGHEGMQPFIDDCVKYGKGLFALVKTSNRGSEQFQLLETSEGPNYLVMGKLVSDWGTVLTGKSGYSSLGAVVGATFPAEAELLRKQMKSAVFLVPGYGAQGGGASDVVSCFNPDGRGAIVNSSRAIIFAWQKEGDSRNYKKYASAEAKKMKHEISVALSKKGICRWQI